MRTLILSFLKKDSEKHQKILKKLEAAAVAKGQIVDVKDAKLDRENLHLVMYEYIAIVVPAHPFSSKKVPELLPEVLATCGNVSGKKGCALIVKSGLFSQKFCNSVMKKMEKEGMKIDYFDVINNVDHAAHVGKKIG
jgi:hypothetical protein